jgi:hypothetical protein
MTLVSAANIMVFAEVFIVGERSLIICYEKQVL